MVDVRVALGVQVPLYLAATCTLFGFACGVQDYGISVRSQECPYSALLGSTVDTCSASVYEASGRISHVLYVSGLRIASTRMVG